VFVYPEFNSAPDLNDRVPPIRQCFVVQLLNALKNPLPIPDLSSLSVGDRHSREKKAYPGHQYQNERMSVIYIFHMSPNCNIPIALIHDIVFLKQEIFSRRGGTRKMPHLFQD
jgi:hypothetical protein